MAGPAIDPNTGEFMLPGPCPEEGCPPTREMDCLLVEKVFDQCFTEDIITRRFVVPTEPGEASCSTDLTRVNRVECTILNEECTVVDVSPPINGNVRIVTVRQDVEINIELWHDPPGGSYKPKLICSFTEKITDFYSQFQLYVPHQG